MAAKRGLWTVKRPDNETERKIREHNRKKRRYALYILCAVLVVLLIVKLIFALGSFDAYAVRASLEIGESSASSYAGFRNNVLEYSNDGIVYMDAEGKPLWNQAFDMTDPQVDICGNYLVVYDKGGTEIYILTADGLQKSLEMVMPIRTACIANQGTVAVLLQEDNNSYIRLYDKNGTELAGGQFYASEGCLPIDIALSEDAQKLAVDMIDISGGKVDTTISFYNFGSVGQNEIDNQVGSYSYEDTLIPDIYFMSSGCMAAVGDSSLILYDNSQKPQEKKTIDYEQKLRGTFHNDKYIGIVYSNEDESNSSHILVYDSNGKNIMEQDTDIAYTTISLLDNNEVCVLSDLDCELFTIHSIKKFSYTFDEENFGFLYGGSANTYISIRCGIMEKIHLH